MITKVERYDHKAREVIVKVERYDHKAILLTEKLNFGETLQNHF